MLDIRFILNHRAQAQEQLARRGCAIDLAPLCEQAQELHAARIEWEAGRGLVNRNQGTPELKARLKALQARIEALDTQVAAIMLTLPNCAHPDTPDGMDAEHNREVFRKEPPQGHGGQHNHADFGKKVGWHPDVAAQLTGARFHVWGPGTARLGRKLMNLAMDHFAQAHGYEEHAVPVIVHQKALEGTGQWPKFKDDLFALKTDQPWYLIPTGEVPLTNIVAGTTLNTKDHPTGIVKMMTTTPCFRQEAGAAGRDTRGLLRQHQFEKLELVNVCAPNHGQDALGGMLNEVRTFLDMLPIGYRVVELCAGDMGFAGHRAYDIEAWFPGTQTWREIATLTWCHDFQARRMKTFWRDKEGKRALAHTLNGTGLALGRVCAALAETWYEEGKEAIVLPEDFVRLLEPTR